MWIAETRPELTKLPCLELRRVAIEVYRKLIEKQDSGGPSTEGA
jgi:hypothetical protein